MTLRNWAARFAWTGAIVALGLAGAGRAAPVSVTTASGVVVGDDNGTTEGFRGIPYAAPPVGPLRWRPPQPPASWASPRPATAFGPACPQTIDPSGKPNGGGVTGPTSEDCLTLNLWAPKAAHGAPVMVFVHGGANLLGAGSAPTYDGSAFARDGVILVTFNYRLGALGTFAHRSLTAEAGPGDPLVHYAVMDQVAALNWVRTNIVTFGGDPANVTLFGESAGGENTLTLLTTPAARGLFARAIVESGLGWSKPVTLEKAQLDGRDTVLRAGGHLYETAAELRAIPADTLVAAQKFMLGYVVDGRFSLETTAQAFARGHAAPVPLIIGSNSGEASLIDAFHLPPSLIFLVVPASVRPAYGDITPTKAKADAMFTDAFMGAPARWIAGKANPSWNYFFAHVSQNDPKAAEGAAHASELPYVFDSWDSIASVPGTFRPTADDLALTQLMHGCWVVFARTGQPSCPGIAPWPQYDSASQQSLRFDKGGMTQSHFRQTRYDAMEAALLPTLGL